MNPLSWMNSNFDGFSICVVNYYILEFDIDAKAKIAFSWTESVIDHFRNHKTCMEYLHYVNGRRIVLKQICVLELI